MNFADLGLGESLVKVVSDCGYQSPTAIQERAIPKIFEGKDILGSAQTGSGKTAGFALPLIEMMSRGRHRHRMARALVLEPTRELAAQVLEDFDTYSKSHEIRSVLLTGGVKLEVQQRALLKHMDVIIATPGRLLDIYERGRLLLPDIRYLVIDEADRMLDMGFIPDVERIVNALPKDRQTLLFSATIDKQVEKIASKFLNRPVTINVAPPSTVAATVSHRLARTTRVGKAAALTRLIEEAREGESFNQAIVFCNRKRDIDPLVKSMKLGKHSAAALHGDMSQPQRTHTLAQFKKGEHDILVASDVAARGLDIDTVSHVFNYDVPLTVEDYVHRIGRTGRAGRSGEAITLATAAEAEQLAAIRNQLQKGDKQFNDPDSDGRGDDGGDGADESESSGESRGYGRGNGRRDSRRESRGDSPGGRSRGSPRGRPSRGRDRDDSRRDGPRESRGYGRGESRDDSKRDGPRESRGYGRSDSRGDSRRDGPRESRGESRGYGRSDSRGDSRRDGPRESRGESRGYGRGDSRSDSRRDGPRESRGYGRSDSRGDSRRDGPRESRGESRGYGRSDSRGDSRRDGPRESRGESRGYGRSDSRGDSRRESPRESTGESPRESTGESPRESSGESSREGQGDFRGDRRRDSREGGQREERRDDRRDNRRRPPRATADRSSESPEPQEQRESRDFRRDEDTAAPPPKPPKTIPKMTTPKDDRGGFSTEEVPSFLKVTLEPPEKPK